MEKNVPNHQPAISSYQLVWDLLMAKILGFSTCWKKLDYGLKVVGYFFGDRLLAGWSNVRMENLWKEYVTLMVVNGD